MKIGHIYKRYNRYYLALWVCLIPNWEGDMIVYDFTDSKSVRIEKSEFNNYKDIGKAIDLIKETKPIRSSDET